MSRHKRNEEDKPRIIGLASTLDTFGSDIDRRTTKTG